MHFFNRLNLNKKLEVYFLPTATNSFTTGDLALLTTSYAQGYPQILWATKKTFFLRQLRKGSGNVD